MKINPANGLNSINPYQKQIKKADAAKSAGELPKDRVEISTAAKDMQDTSRVLTERREKIALLKNEIDSGTYKIDADETAKAMLQFYGKM